MLLFITLIFFHSADTVLRFVLLLRVCTTDKKIRKASVDSPLASVDNVNDNVNVYCEKCVLPAFWKQMEVFPLIPINQKKQGLEGKEVNTA